MRVLACFITTLPLIGCAADAEPDTITIDSSALSRPAGYITYATYTTPYPGGYRPYYTYGGRSPLYSKPYYYRDDYPSRRLYRPPGYENFGEHPDPLFDRYPFDDGRYDRRFSQQHYDPSDRRFSERYDPSYFDHSRHNARRSTYSPPGDHFRFRGDHFRGTSAGRSSSPGRR